MLLKSSVSLKQEIKYDKVRFYQNFIYGERRIDYLNANHYDYRGLIPMGLAIEVTDENNPYKDEITQ